MILIIKGLGKFLGLHPSYGSILRDVPEAARARLVLGVTEDGRVEVIKDNLGQSEVKIINAPKGR